MIFQRPVDAPIEVSSIKKLHWANFDTARGRGLQGGLC